MNLNNLLVSVVVIISYRKWYRFFIDLENLYQKHPIQVFFMHYDEISMYWIWYKNNIYIIDIQKINKNLIVLNLNLDYLLKKQRLLNFYLWYRPT